MERPSVSVEYVPVDDTDLLTVPPPQPGGSRKNILIIAVLLVLVVAIVLGSRPDEGLTASGDPITTPTSAPPSEDDNPTATEPEPVAANVEFVPVGDPITSPVKSEAGWLALRQGLRGGRLVESSDGLHWTAAAGNLTGGNLFGLTRDRDHFVTLVNSSALGAVSHTLTAQQSADAADWRVVDSEQRLRGAGNRPALTSLRNGTWVAVGDEPLAPSVPPPGLVASLRDIVDDDVAERACDIGVRRTGEDAVFEVLDCAAETLTTITDVDQPTTNDLLVTRYLLALRHVASVRTDDGQLHKVPMPPATRIVSLQAVEGGFFAVAIDALASMHAGGRDVGDPAVVLSWSAEDGIRVVDGFPIELENSFAQTGQLTLRPDGTLVYAGNNSVAASAPPYTSWTRLFDTRSSETSPSSLLRVSADGEGFVHVAADGSVRVARLDGDWHRVPELDDHRVVAALLTTDAGVVLLVDLAGFVSQLVLVPLPAA